MKLVLLATLGPAMLCMCENHLLLQSHLPGSVLCVMLQHVALPHHVRPCLEHKQHAALSPWQKHNWRYAPHCRDKWLA